MKDDMELILQVSLCKIHVDVFGREELRASFISAGRSMNGEESGPWVMSSISNRDLESLSRLKFMGEDSDSSSSDEPIEPDLFLYESPDHPGHRISVGSNIGNKDHTQEIVLYDVTDILSFKDAVFEARHSRY